MKKILLLIILTFTIKGFSQTIEISHPFLASGFFDFGILDPFERCNNLIITSNSLNCQVLENGDKIRISIPTTFTASNSITPVDLQIIQDSQPIPGSALDFSILRNGSPIAVNSTESFIPLIPVSMTFQIDLWLFGINSTNIQTGEVSLELILN